jgi:ribonuclease HI
MPQEPREHLTFYVDGGAISTNPSTIGVYYSVCLEHEGGDRKLLIAKDENNQYFTNNDAEMLAILSALRYLRAHAEVLKPTTASITICSDSQFAVKLSNKEYGSKIPRLTTWQTEVRAALAAVEELYGITPNIRWVPRKMNVERLGH